MKSAGFFLFVLSTLVLSYPVQSSATRWTLVDFGASEETTQTPYSDWNQLLRDTTYTEFVDPDGNSAHSGIVPTSSTPDGQTAYFGVQGTTAISFQRGQKIVATFYNRSGEESYLSCRLTFTDENNPDPSDTSNPWHTMYSTDDTQDVPHFVAVSGHSLVEIEYYIADSSMLSAYNDTVTVGDHYLVNLNQPDTNTNLVLTKIELSDEADTTPPSVPQNLQGSTVSTSQGAGNTVVELRWSPAVDSGGNALGIRAYFIYRNGELYDLVPQDRLEYLGENLLWRDLFVAPNTTYQYTVTAVDKAPFGMYPTADYPSNRHGNESARTATVSLTTPSWQSSSLVNPHGDLTYLGAFRLPDDDGIGEAWSYAHRGLAYYPSGNPGYNPASELPGSLYGFNLQDQIAEISIPIPVKSRNPEDLPRATTLKPFTDLLPSIYDGSSTPSGGAGKALGLGYHAAANGVGERLYYTISNSYGTDANATCLGGFDLSLTESFGAWHVGALPPNNVFPGLVSTVVFSAPQQWAVSHTGGRSLIIGNAYISGCGVPSSGPSLYAVAPWQSGELPASGDYVSSVELLRYGSGYSPGQQNINFSYDEFGEGGAWLTSGSRSAVAISYRRTMGDVWYSYSNGINNCEFNIPPPVFGSHGSGATEWAAGLLLYNPDDLAAVAGGIMESYAVLPYTAYDLAQFSIREGGGREAGAIAFDSGNGYLYFIEQNGDPGYEYGYSLIHVWKIQDRGSTAGHSIVSIIVPLLLF